MGWPVFALKGRYVGVCVQTFFKGFSTTRLKKFAERFRGDFNFSKNLVSIFEVAIKDTFFSALPSLFIKKFSKTNSPLGVSLSPYLAKVEVKILSKKLSTASTMTTFISTRRQASLRHDLPLQLCVKWPVFAVKGRYLGV